jgi:hypothetical protein
MRDGEHSDRLAFNDVADREWEPGEEEPAHAERWSMPGHGGQLEGGSAIASIARSTSSVRSLASPGSWSSYQSPAEPRSAAAPG